MEPSRNLSQVCAYRPMGLFRDPLDCPAAAAAAAVAFFVVATAV